MEKGRGNKPRVNYTVQSGAAPAVQGAKRLVSSCFFYQRRRRHHRRRLNKEKSFSNNPFTNKYTHTHKQTRLDLPPFFLEEEEEEGGDTKERQAQEQVRKRRAALLYKIRERELHGETLLDKCQCLLRSRRRVLIKQTADFHHNEIPRAAAAAATHITHG